CWLMVFLLCSCGGCTRKFFREKTDSEVDCILSEKERDPRWRLGEFNVYPDPRARFADFTNFDHPPTPPDDPWTGQHTPRPQRIKNVQYVEGTGYLTHLQECDRENRRRAAERKRHIGQPKEVKDLVRDEIQRMIGPAGPVVP